MELDAVALRADSKAIASALEALESRASLFDRAGHTADTFCSCNSFNSSVTVNGTVNQVDLAKLQVLHTLSQIPPLSPLVTYLALCLQASVSDLDRACLRSSGRSGEEVYLCCNMPFKLVPVCVCRRSILRWNSHRARAVHSQ